MPNLIAFADDALRVVNTTYQNGGFQDPNDNLSGYGAGRSYVRFDRRMKQSPFSNNYSALRSSGNGAFFGGIPQIAFSSARTQRGEVLPTLIDKTVNNASYPFLSGVMTPAFRFAAGSSGLAAAAPIGAAVSAIFVGLGLGRVAASGVRYVSKFGFRQRRMEQGGDYEDTETAQAFRLRAVSEMSSALSYSRRWLGNEALFMR